MYLLVTAFDSVMNWGYTAQALGDPSVTIEQVTPPVFPSGALFPTEVHCQLYQLVLIFLSLNDSFVSFIVLNLYAYMGN